ncbi:hypothetical protein FGG08_007324 [Glutinoglossum americanum]|uniref:Cofilin n=1 Tax=Glutinoglossum americanum TaxID=1670608 RepID=A0A9P8HZQ2_9PEZI|nr:hypothetical protein FGG08_007324 [Glutinoglossum americanum]
MSSASKYSVPCAPEASNNILTSHRSTGITDKAINKFNELKLGKTGLKYVVFKLAGPFGAHTVEPELEETEEPGKEPGVVEYAKKPGESDEEVWNKLMEHLEKAKMLDKRGKEVKGPRYAVFDFDYHLKGGEGQRKKIALISYCPSDVNQYWMVLHASSWQAVKSKLNVSDTFQIDERISYNSALSKVDNRADLGEE